MDGQGRIRAATTGRERVRRRGQGLRGVLLPHVRHQPRRARRALRPQLHALLRGPQGRRRRGDRPQTGPAALRAMPALRLHGRLPAHAVLARRHPRVCQRQPPARRRGAPAQVQPDVSAGAQRAGKLLRSE